MAVNRSRVPNAKLQALRDRAVEAGLTAELSAVTGDDDYVEELVRVEFKRGKLSRPFYLDEDDVEKLNGHDLGSFVFLGSFNAFADRATGAIEAVVASPNAMRISATRLKQLIALHGVEDLSEPSEGPAEEIESDDEEAATVGTRRLPSRWRLRLTPPGGGPVVLEIGAASPLSRAFFYSANVTLRIEGADVSTHDAALAALDRYGRALLFELDLVYDIPLRLLTKRSPTRQRKGKAPERAPSFPRNEYAQQSLALYEYGRSAIGLPLLEFLAYYQAIEYFFPYFAREQVINSLRSTLLHPRFDPSDDGELARILDLSANGGRATVPEREQLRATIRACLSERDLVEFLGLDQGRKAYFYDKKQAIRGVAGLRVGAGADDVRDQVADRIYAIRCRIVHAKQDGGPSNVDVLLPLSAEADALGPDIELVRLVAQQVLVGRAARS